MCSIYCGIEQVKNTTAGVTERKKIKILNNLQWYGTYM